MDFFCVVTFATTMVKRGEDKSRHRLAEALDATSFNAIEPGYSIRGNIISDDARRRAR